MGICGKPNEERKQKPNEKEENISQSLDNSANKNKFQKKNKMKNNPKKLKKNNKDMTYKELNNYKPSSGYDISEGKDNYAYNQNELQNENKIQNTPKADINYPDFDMASPPILEHNLNEVVNNEKDLKRFDENSQIMMKESTTGDWDQKEKDMKNFEN
jgi:hypothetical protein